MRYKHLFPFLGLIVAGLGIAPAKAAQTNNAEVLAAKCQAIQAADFSGVQDAPTQITEIKMMKAENHAPAEPPRNSNIPQPKRMNSHAPEAR